MQFNIPKPCSADWDQMLPTDRGKHCALCKKEVLDLTQSSTEEIRNTLKEEKQTPCVKIESKQLTTLNTTKLSLKPLLRAAVAALISGLIIVPPNKIIAQELDYSGYNPHTQEEVVSASKTDTNIITISGQVIDENDEAVPFANVFLEKAKIGVTTDFDGHFTIDVPRKILEQDPILQVQFIGYKTVTVDYTDDLKTEKNSFTNQIIMMIDEVMIGMMGVIIIEVQSPITIDDWGNVTYRLNSFGEIDW